MCRPTGIPPTAPRARPRSTSLNLNLFSHPVPDHAQRIPRDLRAGTAAPQRRPRPTFPPTPAWGIPPFRFGNPYFLEPNVDELLWRMQIKNNLSMVTGSHTFKVGGEWLHTLNDQVFRGFFNGRYLFGSVSGFLRYASPAAAGGFGPNAVGCSNGSWVTRRPRARRAARCQARRCSSISRSPEPAFRASIRPASRCSPTKTSRCSRRTNGRSVRTSRSTTAFAGMRS